MSTDQPPKGVWGRLVGYHEVLLLHFTEGVIVIEPRLYYCDRGNWIAKVFPNLGSELDRSLDSADMWPRYYFDLDRAKLEVEAWLHKRKLL